MTQEREAQCDLHGRYVSTQAVYSGRPFGPWSTCPSCAAEAKRIEDEAIRREDVRRFLAGAGLLPRFATVTFDDFEVRTQLQRQALQAVRDWADRVESANDGGGLILLGTPGSGKTLLASCALRFVIERSAKASRIVTARELIREQRDTWGRGAAETESAFLRRHANYFVLAIDDLGAGLGSESEHAQLFDIVNARWGRRAPCIVTSNLGVGQLREAAGTRAVDRLLQDATCVVLPGESYRRPAVIVKGAA